MTDYFTVTLVVAAGAQLGMVWVTSGNISATMDAVVAAMLLLVVGMRIVGDDSAMEGT